MITILLIIIGIALYLIFRNKKEDEISDLPLPYIYNTEFLNTLNTFQSLENHNEILVIHGPKGIGKSRGLLEFSNKVLTENRLVINFDFQMLHNFSTDSDIIELIKHSLIHSFQKFDGHLYRQKSIQESIDLLKSLTHVFQVRNSKLESHSIKDTKLLHCLNSILRLISPISDKPDISINFMFKGFEAISKSFRPIIIINSPENLFKVNTTLSNTIYSGFLRSLQQSQHDSTHYGIIIEVSDELYLLEQLKYYSEHNTNFRLFKVGEFELEDARVPFLPMFKPAQEQRMFERFGGNGKHFAFVHELMRNGKTFNDAFNMTKENVKNNFMNFVVDKENVTNTLEMLKVMKEKEVKIDLNEDNYVKELVKEGIMTVVKDGKVAAAEQAYIHCANEILSGKV
ncbi:hypothetical protein GPJ56_000704 [Histomonas meleagridis]|uniref:uncharacterized protein n=1 Tax=Histomonas meleagridis TaxID=135588 RepID=UPI003559EBCB|nr:hypothetical protein GPJ56_000704 [Histomonas meleagridis]KAH0804537.1 hypothetical protein GO595_003367 [Histomonas meleagridis]